ncbi:MAG: PAS domain-containing protein, partial [Methanomicrobiales archaeon]|nr:PAS domain-containing protein [Methanomicrobiales archaeon]
MESERQQLYAVLDTLPVYVVLLSGDYHVPFANRFFRERFGESHGKRCYEYLFGRSEPCENCETYKVMKTRAPHHWEWLGPDNRNYDIHDYPFRDTDGSNLIMEVGIDITEQKRAHEELERHGDNLEALVGERTKELEESEQRLRILYESMIEGLANYEVVYEEGRAVDYIITDVNPAFERITGIPRGNAVGRRASELYGTRIPPFLELYARVASGAGPEQFETYFPPMKQHFSVSAFSPGKGRFATVFTDITKRKQDEESLREIALRFRTVAENTYDWEFWLDPEGRFLYCSPSCERFTGHRAE